jgi:hypothetical protein
MIVRTFTRQKRAIRAIKAADELGLDYTFRSDWRNDDAPELGFGGTAQRRANGLWVLAIDTDEPPAPTGEGAA